MLENVLSHTYVLPNVDRIFSAKSFSLGNLSYLTNFWSSLQSRLTQLILHIIIKICYAHGRPQKFFQGGQSRHFAYLFQAVGNANGRIQKMSSVTATVACMVFLARNFTLSKCLF